MPSKTKKQANFMAAVANNPKFAKKVGVPQSVGKDFTKADKGKTFKEGGMPNMRKDKRTMRNLDDEVFRIDKEKAFEKRQMNRMNKGGLAMVEKGGKKVPFYAADGKGKMNMGGKVMEYKKGGMTGGKKKSIDGVADRGRTRCKGDS
tara:strand:+ start:79 stop:519 length:441 start_codon:yes stop_codon:yes gene_type:complete